MIRTLATALAFCATAAAADMPRLHMPVDCTLGDTCFIQNYVDHDPGPEAFDFTCASLTYDTHRGTDFALIDMEAMHAGVDVRAAAPGRVSATRDGMADILHTDPDAPDITNRSCGNAVIVDHGDGWETRYCHLKRGSLRVRSGTPVTPDTIIGQVGLSGKTEFPHLHISLLKDGTVVDPFLPNAQQTCGTTGETLWSDPIGYTAGGLIGIGFSDGLPEFSAIKSGTASAKMLFRGSDAMVLWAHVFGGRDGDQLRFAISNRRGSILQKTVTLTRTQARLFRAVGKKRPDIGWRPGTYRGQASLIRGGRVLGTQTIEIAVNP